MEDPTVRARAPDRLRRVCERNRLERQLMSEAYEGLVPVVRCRCGRPAVVEADGRSHRTAAADRAGEPAVSEITHEVSLSSGDSRGDLRPRVLGATSPGRYDREPVARPA